jgi:hypothetical protein
MTHHQFLNAIKILHSIDMHELVEAGAMQHGDGATWQAFRSNPCKWLIRADDKTADAIYGIIERRQPRTVSVAAGIDRVMAP